MAIIKFIKKRKKQDGTYDTLHPETSASFVTTADASDVETKLAGFQTQINGKQKNITSVTEEPTGGTDGDIYLQYS